LLSNAADGVFRALDNVDTAVELNTPISMGMFDSIIKRIEYEEGVRFQNLLLLLIRVKVGIS
jgi:hypothetical protein